MKLKTMIDEPMGHMNYEQHDEIIFCFCYYRIESWVIFFMKLKTMIDEPMGHMINEQHDEIILLLLF